MHSTLAHELIARYLSPKQGPRWISKQQNSVEGHDSHLSYICQLTNHGPSVRNWQGLAISRLKELTRPIISIKHRLLHLDITSNELCCVMSNVMVVIRRRALIGPEMARAACA
jgi:hypothetical protein